jgi:hypothetical protein
LIQDKILLKYIDQQKKQVYKKWPVSQPWNRETKPGESSRLFWQSNHISILSISFISLSFSAR